MQALLITAHLPAGFAGNDPWSPSLDGILAWAVMRERLGADAFQLSSWDDSQMRPVEGLPLAVERHGDLWWYQASAPIYDARAEFLRYYHRRFDAHLAERYAQPKKGRIGVTAGPYKNFRLSARIQVCDRVSWHALGNAAEVRRLLAGITSIGARVAMGCGRVRSWSVEIGGDEARARFGRPLPVEFARAHGVDGSMMRWGIRPPARLPENKCLCVMPS